MAYFSNGSEGSVLDEQCADCPIGKHPDAPCPVLWVQLQYNYKQYTGGKPNQIADVLNCLVNEKGICQMRKVMVEWICKPTDRPIHPRQVLPGMEEWAKKSGLL